MWVGRAINGCKECITSWPFWTEGAACVMSTASRIDLSHKGFGEELFMIMPIFSFNVDSPNNLQI